MSARPWVTPVLVVGVLATSVVAIGYSIATGEEIATVVLSVPVLMLSAATLWLALPRPARLILIRQDELELDDLIFFLYPLGSAAKAIPRDYLLQLHVAVCNVGDRKAVISAIRLKGFFTEDGTRAALPDAPQVLAGHQWVQRSGWVIAGQGMTHRMEANSVPPPYVLEPDDVVTVRFRTRRGIDWSPQWDLAALRSFCELLEAPIVREALEPRLHRRGGRRGQPRTRLVAPR
jgi:hypothetical protein